MCGIAGCYQQADGRKLVEIMTDRIAHRGPDAAGIWEHGDDRVTAQLGHRQLSKRRELELFAKAVRTGAPMPIPLESLVATTSATIAVADSLASGRPERV